ncbi:Hypothetical protein A7982_06804 [Minicystis rosea]|nr:Hypothetical protein A7982_06804 [Minicystis rosea]
MIEIPFLRSTSSVVLSRNRRRLHGSSTTERARGSFGPIARAFPALVFLALALAPMACRKSMAPACRQVCACVPCTDNDLDACIEKAETAQDHADSVSCTEPFEALVDCFERRVSCSQGTASASNDCSRATKALASCADAGNPFSTVCEESTAKISTCTGKPSQGNGGACTGQNACQAACIVEAPCEAIDGTMFVQTFNDCVNRCAGVTTPPF